VQGEILMKGENMNQDGKKTVKELWAMRNVSVDDFLESITTHPDLKFLLTTVGAWFALRCLLFVWIGTHVIYIVYRIFNLVLN